MPASAQDLQVQSQKEKLTLNSLYSNIDAQHPELEKTRFAAQGRKADLMGTKSAFIPKLRNRTFGSSALDKSFKRNTGFASAGELDWQSPFGFEITASLRTARDTSFLGDDDITYSANKNIEFDNVRKQNLAFPSDTALIVGLRMPLARNLLIDAERADVQRAGLEVSVAELDVWQKRANLFLKASEKYWDWVGMGLKLAVAQKLLDFAQFRQAGIADKASEGASPRIDVIEGQSQIFSRQESLVKARRSFEKESLALSAYLWIDAQTISDPARTELSREPILLLEVSDSLFEEHLRLASSSRPEILALSLLNQREGVNVRQAKNDFLPRIDFEVTPQQGLGRGRDFSIYGGVVTEMPAFPLKARSMLDKARLKIEENKRQLQLEEVSIFNQIRDARSQIQTSSERASFAKSSYDSLQELAEGERTRFQYGNTNLFTVNQREMAAAEGENKLIEALVDHQKALASYRYSIGEWSIAGFGDSWFQEAQSKAKTNPQNTPYTPPELEANT